MKQPSFLNSASSTVICVLLNYDSCFQGMRKELDYQKEFIFFMITE